MICVPGLDQAAVDRPATSFQVMNRVCISRRYWAAARRWRRGRKCRDIPLNADRNRCAPPWGAEVSHRSLPRPGGLMRVGPRHDA
jgi:hypothetical protein